MEKLIFSRNGEICFGSKTNIIGKWKKRDIHAEMKKKYGDKFNTRNVVHYVWSIALNNGYKYDYCYTAKEMKELVLEQM